ncbi:hypothetical protein HPB47_000535 [Ixodes persulcatus]|uniref:Uncharacterized protein n=1 Tax=Ixodes persulcatus TaxID=34615 RepID=A0AC60PT04_IXOPE|nr:hypothetical protein HPB47_000535 [Ixodes persulcatus]
MKTEVLRTADRRPPCYHYVRPTMSTRVKEEKRKSEEGQAMMAKLQGILREEVEKRVDLEAQWDEMKMESRVTVVPEVQGASEQEASSSN